MAIVNLWIGNDVEKEPEMFISIKCVQNMYKKEEVQMFSDWFV